MFRSIAVGVEIDNSTDAAAKVGAWMATLFDAPLELVHVSRVDLPVWRRVPPSRWKLTLAKAEAMSRRACRDHLDSLLGEVHGSTVDDMLTVTIGHPAEGLVRFVENHDTDLLVIGGTRHQGLFDYGTTVRGLLGSCPCPVWVQTDPVEKINRILVPIDLSPHSMAALAVARDLAKRTGADLLIQHSFMSPGFVHPYEEAGIEMERFRVEEREHFDRFVAEFDGEGVSVEGRFTVGMASCDIISVQDEVDLIVMGTHGRTGLARAILGSHAQRVIRKATRGIVVVPQPEGTYLLNDRA